MNHPFVLPLLFCAVVAGAADSPAADPGDPLRTLGLLDVTKAPYLADPSGARDSTEAIQRAVNDARDNRLVCFFPEGTYLISEQISCEQKVYKLDTPKGADGRTQHYWDESHRIVLFGSGKGKRPVIKLAAGAQGFGDPAKPKAAVWIWAQTRDDAPGKQEPIWGLEQPNIAFSHFLKGIDIDVRGHAGAIGLRFSASQGSSLLDCTVQAEGAFAGFSDCPGQGGGTYNIEAIGGRYGITIDSMSRFPILTGCRFRGQTVAAIGYNTNIQVPTLLVGCELAPASGVAVDFTTQENYAGINMIDCLVSVEPGGVVAKTKKSENIHLETTYVKGAQSAVEGGKALPSADGWNLIEQYSSTVAEGVHVVNGAESTDEIVRWEAAQAAPGFDELREKHYRRIPAWDEEGVVNVMDFGAVGDGETDDTEAFEKAIAAGDSIFVPKGSFNLKGTLELNKDTHFFGLTRTFSSMGGGGFGYGGRGAGAGAPSGGSGRGPAGAGRGPGGPGGGPATAEQGPGGEGSPGESFSIVTVDDPDAAPGFSHLSVRGDIQWRSGKGTVMLAGGLPRSISGHGGGRFYGIMAMGRQLVLENLTNPIALYSFNVERVTTNPQCVIRNCKNLSIYYYKVEAGTLGRGGDANTPGAIVDSENIRIYCMYGNVKGLGERPMLHVENSRNIAVSQLKAFQPSSFPHLIEQFGDAAISVPSTKIVSLFVRD